jgi:hypothetical protein
MGAGRGRARCALWGGLSLGVGTLAFALFSPSSVGCSTNVVVLTRSAVTARGCAAYSVVAHLGVGLIVLGGVLLLGSFALALRTRRAGAAAVVATPAATVPAAATAPAATPAPAPATVADTIGRSVNEPPVAAAPAAATPAVEDPTALHREPGAADPIATGSVIVRSDVVSEPGPGRAPEWSSEPVEVRTRPIAPGEDVSDHDRARPDGSGLLESAVRLPPGWYGNPDNPGRPVQWWDGTRLTDGPG